MRLNLLRLVLVRAVSSQKGKVRLSLTLPFFVMESYAHKTPPVIGHLFTKPMLSLTVSTPQSKIELPTPLTPAELDEQAQLAHDEALWQDRCDYYQSAR
jgi:hypothetical protein